MIDTKGRWVIEKPIKWLAQIAHKLKLKPNQITIAAFIIGCIAGLFIAYDHIVVAVLFLWTSGLLDVIDGQLARLSNQTSQSGALLDMILDRMVEAAFVLGMVIANQSLAIPVILFLITVIFNFSTFLAAGALIPNDDVKSMHYDVGLIERTETFILLTFAAILPSWRLVIICLMTFLIAVTGIKRFIKIFKLLDEVS